MHFCAVYVLLFVKQKKRAVGGQHCVNAANAGGGVFCSYTVSRPRGSARLFVSFHWYSLVALPKAGCNREMFFSADYESVVVSSASCTICCTSMTVYLGRGAVRANEPLDRFLLTLFIHQDICSRMDLNDPNSLEATKKLVMRENRQHVAQVEDVWYACGLMFRPDRRGLHCACRQTALCLKATRAFKHSHRFLHTTAAI